jgi:hypothetical protein
MSLIVMVLCQVLVYVAQLSCNGFEHRVEENGLTHAATNLYAAARLPCRRMARTRATVLAN